MGRVANRGEFIRLAGADEQCGVAGEVAWKAPLKSIQNDCRCCGSV